MCPFCLATAAILAGSTAGTGGLAAAVTGLILSKKSPTAIQSNLKEVRDGNHSRDRA